jgi:hypothetical protein
MRAVIMHAKKKIRGQVLVDVGRYEDGSVRCG